jgi:rubrerythrin
MFRGADILDMAVQIEYHGLAFYEAFLNHASEQKVKDLMHFLIRQEQKHVEVFTEMKKTLAPQGAVPAESYQGETQEYIASFVKDRVFRSPEEAAQRGRSITDPFEAVEIALEFENRSIGFYSDLKDSIQASGSEIIEKVIAEERDHIRRLTELRRQMGSGQTG